MLNNGIDPATLSLANLSDETILNDYAETEYVYNGSRVLTMYTHGRTYTYGFVYTVQSQASPSMNVWTAKCDITEPDNSLLTYYFNRGGQVILKRIQDNATSPTKTWYEYSQQFEEYSGRVVVRADAAAIFTVNEATPTLVALYTHAGKVETTVYHSSGHVHYTGVQEGILGTLNKLTEFTYASHPVSGLGTIYVPVTETVYRGDASTDGVTTNYAYTWWTPGGSDTFQLSQRTTTLPAVPTSENGTNVSVVLEENFDQCGYPSSSVDGRGTITQFTYNWLRGALTQRVEDYGGLNLTTDYTVDDLGRTTLTLGPAHDIDLGGGSVTNLRRGQWTYYKDREGEVWSFAGYRATSGSVDQVINPVTVSQPNIPPPAGYTGYIGFRQGSVVDAPYGSGIPSPTASFASTFPQSTWLRRNLSMYSKSGQLKEEWNYFLILSSGYGTPSINFGQKFFAYDAAGRLNQTTCAGGTIDKTTFNAMGWSVQEELGTSSGLTITRLNEYYDNGTLKKVTLPVDTPTSGTERVTEKTYDFRQRLTEDKTTVEKDGGGTWTLFVAFAYDNRDLPVSVTTYHTSVGSGNRTGYKTMAYDAMGRRYRGVTYAVNGATTGNSLTDNWYFDVDGQVARQALSGSTLTTVNQYDVLGRRVKELQATGTFSTSAPSSVANATVMEQTVFLWDDAGNVISTTFKQRFDNANSTTGDLGDPTTQPLARISYTAIYPDALGRQQAAANYGTYAAASWSRSSFPVVPTRSDTVLVTSTLFGSAGNVSTVTDPAGIITEYTYDNADRLTTLVENQGGSGTAVRTTHYEYTADGWLTKLKSDNASTGQQVTEWVYGVTTSQGSALYSNRLVYQKKYPDYAGGSDLVTYTYNAQLQVIGMTDQAGTAHAYGFDKLGRLLSDTVSAFGSGVDNTINKLDNGYDERGRLSRAASYVTGTGAKDNEIQWDYNDFNQPVTEYQEHGGAVNPSLSLKVQYTYANGSANTIRPTGIIRPDLTAIATDYGSTLADALSRPDAIKESSTTLASFKFLGLRTPVDLKYDAASNAEWTMQNGGTGDAGDIYTGLDRFGRLVETIWKTSSATLVNTTYGRNRASGVKWKRDDLAHSMSVTTEDHFYWYDGLQQNYQHQRGNLTGSPYSGITSPPAQDEVRTFDETGNWLSDSTTATVPPPVNQTRTHNKANEIASFSAPSGVPTPAFDPAGNMTTAPAPDGWTLSCTLTWDAWNRLVSFNNGFTTTTNKYDALYRRITETVGTDVHEYFYDRTWRAVEERIPGGAGFDKVQYTWSPFDRWTMIRRQRDNGGTPVDTHYLLKDYLDPAAIVNPSTGSVVERFSYEAFGGVRFLDASFVIHHINASTVGWNLLFHAEFRDKSKLYNYGFRFYHTDLGRWLSRDPIADPNAANFYKMVQNDPVGQLDSYGLLEGPCCVNGVLTTYIEAEQCCEKSRNGSHVIVPKRADYFGVKCCNRTLIELRVDPAPLHHPFLFFEGRGYGHYSAPGEDAYSVAPVKGIVQDDTTHEYSHSLTKYYFACQETVEKLKKSIKSSEDDEYAWNNRKARNCAGWVCQRLKDIGIELPFNPEHSFLQGHMLVKKYYPLGQ